MVLSLSNDQTTLYDQIEYAGSPESFAWVLPINGVGDVGLSSDLVFNVLDSMSGVTIQSPTINCGPQTCGASSSAFTSTTTSTGPGGGGVDVLAQETVGPFETVQLAATDPSALTDWLTSHGYNIPSDIQPLIDAYVAEGFNFLAMKLVPGAGVDAMRPVRITVPGASPALPLRMVAAGTGATTTVTLWVIAEGRYQPANFPWFVIDESELVWNWDTQSSNYKTIRQERYDASGGLAWQIESANPFSQQQVTSEIENAVVFDVEASGYDPANATQEAAEDLAALFGSLTQTSTWFTRFRGELSRAAFTKDLVIEAAAEQQAVPTTLFVTETKGTAPSCPPPPDCDGDGVPDGWEQSDNEDDVDDGSCAARPRLRSTFGWVPLLMCCYLALRWRRRR